MGAVPIAVSTCDKILMGRIAPVYSHQLDGHLDSTVMLWENFEHRHQPTSTSGLNVDIDRVHSPSSS